MIFLQHIKLNMKIKVIEEIKMYILDFNLILSDYKL